MVILPFNFALTADSYEIVLSKIGTAKDSKTGDIKETRTAVGHYSTLSGALRGWYEKLIRGLISRDEQIELKELIAQVKAYEEEVIRSTGNLIYAGGRITSSVTRTAVSPPRSIDS